MADPKTLPSGIEYEFRELPPVKTSHCRANAGPGRPRGGLSKLLLNMPVGASIAIGEDFLGYGSLKNIRTHISTRNRIFGDRGRWLTRQDVDGWRIYRVDPADHPPPLRLPKG